MDFSTGVGDVIVLHRYWNDVSLNHVYSSNYQEFGEGSMGFVREPDVCWIAKRAKPGRVELLRFYNSLTQNHIYTIDAKECPLEPGVTQEKSPGYIWKECDEEKGMISLYHLRNTSTNDDILVTDLNELGPLEGTPWQNFGALGYVYPPGEMPELNDDGDDEDAMDEHGIELPKMAESLVEADKTIVRHRTTSGATFKFNVWTTTTGTIARELGPGNGLYFSWLLWSCVMFIAATLVHLFALVRNGNGTHLGAGDWRTQYSLANAGPTAWDFDQGYIGWENLLSALLFGFVYAAYLIFSRRKTEALDAKYDKQSITADDYSVTAGGLPHSVVNPADYVNHFSKWGEVVRVAIGLDFGKSIKMSDKLEALEDQILRMRIKHANPEKITKKRQQFKEKKKELWDFANAPRQARRAYVTFNFEQSSTRCCMDHMKVTNFCCPPDNVMFQGHRLSVERAPGSTDVAWQNLHVHRTGRQTRDFVATLLAVALLIVVMFSLIGINAWKNAIIQDQENSGDENSDTSILVIDVFAAIAISALNILLRTLLTALAKWTSPHTFTGLEDELLLKLFLALFLNTGFILYLTYPFVWTPQWARTIGRQIISILIADAITNNVVRFADPGHLIKRFILAPRAVTSRAQVRLLLGQEWHLADRYAAVLKLHFIALMYAPAQPIVFPLCGLAMMITYWVDKYNLLRSCQAPPYFGVKASLLTVKIQFWGLLFAAIMMWATFGDVGFWAAVPVTILAILVLLYFYREACWEKITCEGSKSDAKQDQGTNGQPYTNTFRALQPYTPPEIPGYQGQLVWESPGLVAAKGMDNQV